MIHESKYLTWEKKNTGNPKPNPTLKANPNPNPNPNPNRWLIHNLINDSLTHKRWLLPPICSTIHSLIDGLFIYVCTIFYKQSCTLSISDTMSSNAKEQ